ncbi:hypothetical protein [Mesorhizobium sp. M6A.T.Cr.TU.014.01.1.1]|uniref:hypothetical protein n=1 Tax=unclassified Mesorhizobium TaxID=325217 RepID=UPI0019D463F3
MPTGYCRDGRRSDLRRLADHSAPILDNGLDFRGLTIVATNGVRAIAFNQRGRSRKHQNPKGTGFDPSIEIHNDNAIRTIYRRRVLHPGKGSGRLRYPFGNVLFLAQTVNRRNFDPNKVQLSRLLGIKTGGLQPLRSVGMGPNASKLMEVQRVLVEAPKARYAGATRYFMGASVMAPLISAALLKSTWPTSRCLPTRAFRSMPWRLP